MKPSFSSNIDKVIETYDDLEKEVNNLSGEVPIDELLTPSFMKEHTSYTTFSDFLEAGNFDVQNADDFEKIPDDVFDKFINENSSFSDWQDMLNAAGAEYFQNQLGF